MTALRGRNLSARLASPLTRSLWRITTDLSSSPGLAAALLSDGDVALSGFDLYLTHATDAPLQDGMNLVVLPPELDYLQAGDVISLSPDGTRTSVLWRATSDFNSILLTERCDNYCLMCSQPPRERVDDWLLAQALELIELLPAAAGELCFTGGEPTFYGEGLVELLKRCRDLLPETDIHILSNGRRFADPEFADAYATIDNPRMMVGIPLYGTEPALHDYVVQAPGAFNETVRGILNLCQLDQAVELRVVLHKQTAPAIVEIAEFIARNLPFVGQVALMGLEMMGLARHNLVDVWIDPLDYREDLTAAVHVLDGAGIPTRVYNHQLCLIDREIWRFAVKSISDWKNDYLPECTSCAVVEDCGGLFSSASYKRSPHIQPIAHSALGPPLRGVSVHLVDRLRRHSVPTSG